MTSPGTRDRYAQCDNTCTVDCGACKGTGRPSAVTPPEMAEAAVIEQVARAIHTAVIGSVNPDLAWKAAGPDGRANYRRYAAAAVGAPPALGDVDDGEPAPGEPHPWGPWEINLCDPDGVVRRGAMHHGQDYQCTGSAHWSGLHIRCTTPVHGQGPALPYANHPDYNEAWRP